MKKALLILLCFSAIQIFAQDKKSSLSAFMFDYTHQFPMAELQENYGDNSSIGISFLKKTSSNLLFAVDGSYIFGSKIKKENF